MKVNFIIKSFVIFVRKILEKILKYKLYTKEIFVKNGIMKSCSPANKNFCIVITAWKVQVLLFRTFPANMKGQLYKYVRA